MVDHKEDKQEVEVELELLDDVDPGRKGPCNNLLVNYGLIRILT